MDRERIAEEIAKAVREVWTPKPDVPETPMQSDYAMAVWHKWGTGQDKYRYIDA